jgi:DNA-binding MarR family transcriptional regulator
MQATGFTQTAVTPAQLASELHELWSFLMRDSYQHVYRLLTELDISMTQMKTIHQLQGCVEELSVKDVSERMGLSLPAASRTIDGLLHRGWVERREDERDRRMKRVRITEAGRGVVRAIEEARLAGLERFAETLTDEQRARLAAALSDLPHRKD